MKYGKNELVSRRVKYGENQNFSPSEPVVAQRFTAVTPRLHEQLVGLCLLMLHNNLFLPQLYLHPGHLHKSA